MSTYYREVKKPARYVRLEQGPAHARITVWDNAGANVGSLTVKAEEANDWLHLFAGDDVAQTIGNGPGEKPTLKLFKEEHEIVDRSLISENGDVTHFAALLRECMDGG